MEESYLGAKQPNKKEAASRNLWEALHDGDVVQIGSDPLARTVTFVLDIDHLRKFAELPDGITWQFVISSVSLRSVCRWEKWPGTAPELKGLSYTEQTAVVAEYQSKGCTLSIRWSDFEQAVNEHGLWLKDATLHRRDSDIVLEGYGHDKDTDTFFEFKLVGEQLQCERSDGKQASLEDLLTLGEAFWNDFSKHAD